ncbi:hypothetical protein GCM10027066_28690 [Dyella jejuensis]
MHETGSTGDPADYRAGSPDPQRKRIKAGTAYAARVRLGTTEALTINQPDARAENR